MPGNMARTLICFLLMAGTLGLARLIDSRPPKRLARPLSSIPSQISDWQGGDDPPLDKDVEDQLKASDHILRTYRSAKGSIGLFVAYYSRQAAGENIHPPRNCLPGNGWNILSNSVVRVPFAAGYEPANAYHIQNGDERRLVLYWYQSTSHISAGEYAAKAFLFWDSLATGNTSSSVVRVTLRDGPGSLETGTWFAAVVMHEVERCLGQSVRRP